MHCLALYVLPSACSSTCALLVTKVKREGTLTASHILKEIVSVTTISLSLPYSKVLLTFGRKRRKSVFFFPFFFFFFFNLLGLLFLINIHGNSSSESMVSVKRECTSLMGST